VDAEVLYDVDGLKRFDMTISAARSVLDQSAMFRISQIVEMKRSEGDWDGRRVEARLHH